MAEEKNKNKEKEEIRESENKSPDDFDKDRGIDTSDAKNTENKSPDDFETEQSSEEKGNAGEKIKESEQKSPDDFDRENEVETSDLKNAEQKSPDDFEEGSGKSKMKSKKNKHAKKNKGEGRKIEELEDKYENLNDKYLRLYSEFDNFRKRTIKEKTEFSKTANQYLLEDLLPVLDDFERAIEALDDEQRQENSNEGFILIYNKLKNTLKNKGLEEMDSKGKEFNTDYHDALTQIPAPSGDLKGKVVDVIEKGYLLNGKVIRYAKVVVGK